MKKYFLLLILLLPVASFAQESTKDSLSYIWKHVYKPEKYEVLDSMVQFTGTVIHMKGKANGDYHILVEPDKKYKSYLSDENKKKEKGALVVIPIFSYASDSLSPAEIAIKGDYKNKVKIPSKGDRVRVRGALVKDRRKGWNAILPVLTIQKAK